MFDNAITVDALAAARRAANVAEARMCALMVDYETQERETSTHQTTSMGALVARSLIPTEVGQAMGWSAQQATLRLHTCRTARSRTPFVWSAFGAGDIDYAAVQAVVTTVQKLHHPESVTRLDTTVVAYASTHTTAELKRWLRRFVERVEPDEAVTRAGAARERRYVRVDHGDDGMSWISAYVPAHVAGAVERRLWKEARRLDADGRTLEQKSADLFAAWLTTSESTTAMIDVDVVLTVPADVLAGARSGFATSADDAWSIPASWVAELAAAGDPFWHRMVVDPVTDDVLSVEYVGRFANATLRRALEIRDGTCATAGCLTPARKCEIDHRIPWPRGSTTATNTRPLSKAHHAHKSHGLTPKTVRPAAGFVVDVYWSAA